jgi:hypothetical protein
VVLSSGYNRQDAISKFADKGLAGSIQKPYGPAKFIPVMRQALWQSPFDAQTDSIPD